MASKMRAARTEWRQTLHEMNRRYLEAWNRAERLQDELDHIKGSRAYRFFTWWHRLVKRRPKPSPAAMLLPFPVENLEFYQRPPAGSVAIVIPFKDHGELLWNCLRSIRRATVRPLRFVLLDNGSACPRTLRYLERLREKAGCKIVPCPGPFNFSRLCNLGAQQTDADFVLFLNNDVEIPGPRARIGSTQARRASEGTRRPLAGASGLCCNLTHGHSDWLDELRALANSPHIGVVGATLVYPDGTLQHAGIFPTVDGQWTHIYRNQPGDCPGDSGELAYARSVPAVTGACLLMRRDLFLEMGGFDERFPVTFNDVDLCCRVRRRGLKVAITPHARLIHFESISRGLSRSLP